MVKTDIEPCCSRYCTLKEFHIRVLYPEMVHFNDFLLDNNSDEDQVLDDMTGTITSPNYPLNYDNNMDLEWTLTAPSNKVIKLEFEAFDV